MWNVDRVCSWVRRQYVQVRLHCVVKAHFQRITHESVADGHFKNSRNRTKPAEILQVQVVPALTPSPTD